MVKGEKKERKKSGKEKSPTADDFSPEARIKKVMELTSCLQSVAEMVLLNNGGDLDQAVLAVLDLPKEDADSWKEGGKVRKTKKQNDADKDNKPVGQGNRRGDPQVNRVRGIQNESRPTNRPAARESQGPRQPPIARVPRENNGRGDVRRPNKNPDDPKSRNTWPPPVDLETNDEELDWQNGPLVFEKNVPLSPAATPVFAPPKSDKPTFAEIAANKKTTQIPLSERKMSDVHDDKEIKEFQLDDKEIKEFQLDDHRDFPSSGAGRKLSTVPSVASKSPSVVVSGSAPTQDMFVNEEFTEKLKNDIGIQNSGHISEFAVAARVKSMREDGEFFSDDEPKQSHFCSLEEMHDDVEVEKPVKKSHKPLMLSYINATMVNCPPKKQAIQKEASRVDKQTEAITHPIVHNPPVQQQQPPVVQNIPLEFQHLSQVHQQMVIALAAQLANSLQFNAVVPGNLREVQAPPSQNMPVSGSVLDAQQPSHLQGRMMPGQQMLQPRVETRVQPGQVGGLYTWQQQQQQAMGSHSGNQVRMHGGMEVPPGFSQAYGSDYQAMLKLQADQLVPSSFENQRVVHGNNLPQMQQPGVGLINPPQRPITGHGFPQNYGYGMGNTVGGGSQQMPQNPMASAYGGAFMHNFQQR